MRWPDLAEPAVDAVDDEPWDMPLARSMRPLSARSMYRLGISSVLLLALSGTAGLILIAISPSAATNPGLFVAFNVAALLFAVLLGGLLALFPIRRVRRSFPVLAVVSLLATPILVTSGFVGGGPPLGFVAVAYVQGPLIAFYVLRTPWAVGYSIAMLTAVALALGADSGWVAPVGAWLFIAANVIGTGFLIGQIAASLDERVNEQVREIQQLGTLRRFLSSQVADVVLAGDSSALTRPHRARVAMFFCDLRGFTAFTNHAEPEEVIEVLDEYYRAVGNLLDRYEATVGDYAGDGIMAYFGDPVPREDAALAAARMAIELGSRMTDVVADWKRRGYDLDYGVGLSFGYVTLGVVGYDGRHDYKPVGGVVNLAARLCAKAGPGEVLLDHAMHAAISEILTSTPVEELDLKGFDAGVRAYVLS